MSDLQQRIKHSLEPVLELADLVTDQRLSRHAVCSVPLHTDEEFEFRRQVTMVKTRLS
jgi:hypothetical protein